MKKLLFALGFLLYTFSASSQDIRSIFSAMPNSILPSLSVDAKTVLITNPDSTNIITSNIFGDKIKRLSISSTELAFETSPSGTVQFKLLPLINNSSVICMIISICGKACDSQIQFFTTTWEPITGSSLFPKKNINWFIKNDIDRSSEGFTNISTALDMTPVKLTFSDNNTISADYDIKNYLSKEDYEKLKPYLTLQPKIFTWDKVSFK